MQKSQPTRSIDDHGLILHPAQIVLITGPSGAGKTSTLRALGQDLGQRAIYVDRQRLDSRRPVVEQVAAGRPLAEAVSILTACGLGEPRLWLRRPAELSDGERFRVRLARAIGSGYGMTAAGSAADRPWQGPVLLVDEFCAMLHRRLACAMAYALRKMVTARGLCLVAATTHEDLLADLQPDLVLRLGSEGSGSRESGSRGNGNGHDNGNHRRRKRRINRTTTTDIAATTAEGGCATNNNRDGTTQPHAGCHGLTAGQLYRPDDWPCSARGSHDTHSKVAAPRPISFFRRLHIEPGRLRDYRLFEAMHYRQRSGLGPFEKILVLRDGVGGEALGVVVYGYSPLSLRLRNVALGTVMPRDGQQLNRDFRILRRLVIHPDVRGCGLAHHLVRRTLPLVGTKYVECLAAMGAVNPVFERAGMVRLGTAEVSGRPEKLRRALAELGVDPLAEDFAQVVATRDDVRATVGKHVHRWVEATTGRPIEKTRTMSPQDLASAFVQLMGTAPIYYLWSRDEQENDRLRELVTRRDPCSESGLQPALLLSS